MKNIINSAKNSYAEFTTSPVAQSWSKDFSTMTTDSVRILNASSVATMRTTALSLRAGSITIEAVNAGLGYALDHTPKTYEETKEGISSVIDNVMAMFDEEEEKTTVQTTV